MRDTGRMANRIRNAFLDLPADGLTAVGGGERHANPLQAVTMPRPPGPEQRSPAHLDIRV
jgi:hypothetical protein